VSKLAARRSPFIAPPKLDAVYSASPFVEVGKRTTGSRSSGRR
jgi:hypothetical protein